MGESPKPMEDAAERTLGSDIINSIDVPIVAVGRDCAIAKFNPAAATLLSLTAADLGGAIGAIPMLMNVKRFGELCEDAIRSGISSQCEVRDVTNESWFVLRIAPYKGSEERIEGAVLTLQNVTAFRASLEQAIYEREYTKAIINAVIDPLVVLDNDCRVQGANQAFYSKFRISRDQAQGVKLHEIGRQDWEILRLQSFLKESHANDPSEAEFEHDFPGIGNRTILLNARRLAQRGNAGQTALVVIQDITERKQREEARRRAEETLRESEEQFRKLSETLDVEVRARTRELEEQSGQVRELSWRLLRTQDEERRHIARELHDSAGQNLAVLGMNLATIARAAEKRAPEMSESVEQALEMVQELTKEIRTTSYLLHPPLLDENGLPAALSWYIRGLSERSGLDIAFSISDEFGRLPRELELVIFRLVQECLTNIHRHSGSKTATIQIHQDAERVLIEARDQGKGIPPEKLAQIERGISGVGIRGMRERLRQFRGEMILDAAQSGTTVVVTIPIPSSMGKGKIDAKSLESAV
jgi:signal transduction histidine kinase